MDINAIMKAQLADLLIKAGITDIKIEPQFDEYKITLTVYDEDSLLRDALYEIVKRTDKTMRFNIGD